VKKKVDATATITMTIAAAETSSVVVCNFVVSFGCGDGDAVLTAGAEGSTIGRTAPSPPLGTLRGGTSLGGTFLGCGTTD
jgi:hypothetical protein